MTTEESNQKHALIIAQPRRRKNNLWATLHTHLPVTKLQLDVPILLKGKGTPTPRQLSASNWHSDTHSIHTKNTR